jgi:hypothetical protein
VLPETGLEPTDIECFEQQSTGNQTNWHIHMMGIEQMVGMRGGLLAFKCDPLLIDKLCRYVTSLCWRLANVAKANIRADICGSVYSTSRPYLKMESISADSRILRGRSETKRLLAPGFVAVHCEHEFESDLIDILYQVQSVTLEMNTVNPPKSEVIPMIIRQKIRSIQYSLLQRENHNSATSPEQPSKACRLGILLYVGIIQNEFWASPISNQLISQLKLCLGNEGRDTGSIRALHLWVLFLAGSLVIDPMEKRWFVRSIIEVASQLSLSSWCDALGLLETFAWVKKVQDKSARDLWDETMRMRSET